MKIIIAGCRDVIASKSRIQEIVEESKFNISEVVCGGASGIDESGRLWAEYSNIPVHIFKASWTTLGRKAGPIRNKEMAKYADGLIALWDGKSRGTGNMIKEMRNLNKPYYVVGIRGVTLIDAGNSVK